MSMKCANWWHDYAKKGHVYFLRGRLKFGSARNSAPFPSAIVTFGRFFSPELAMTTTAIHKSTRMCDPASGSPR
jgi:hypothetical protein